MPDVEHLTGTHDETYKLISLLYHTLQGSERLAQYLEDVQGSEAPELVAFFREIQAQDRDRADRLQVLLRHHLTGSTSHRQFAEGAVDAVDEESMDSFPASDAPANY